MTIGGYAGSSQERFKTVHNSSRRLTTVQDGSQQFTTVHDGSQRFTTVHNCSHKDCSRVLLSSVVQKRVRVECLHKCRTRCYTKCRINVARGVRSRCSLEVFARRVRSKCSLEVFAQSVRSKCSLEVFVRDVSSSKDRVSQCELHISHPLERTERTRSQNDHSRERYAQLCPLRTHMCAHTLNRLATWKTVRLKPRRTA